MTALLIVTGTVALAGAVGVVAFPQTIYSALSLVVTVGSLAVLFLLLDAQFLFAVQIIIYAGAIVVLFIFIIALLNPENEDRPVADRRLLAGLAAAVIFTVAIFAVAHNGITYDRSGFRGARVGSGGGTPCTAGSPQACPDPYHAFSFPADRVDRAGNVQAVGGQLFTTFVLPFEITSLLLLVAAVGAVYLTRHRVRQDLAPPTGRRAPVRRRRAMSLEPLQPDREAGARPLLIPGERDAPGTRRVAAREGPTP